MKTLLERQNEIQNLINNSDYNKKFNIRDEKTTLPVIRLHKDFLLYNISNSRTKRQQQKYLRDFDKADDFFRDTENNEVQLVQEQILIKMVVDQTGFIDDLEKRGQQDELLVTTDGYIINGNRRTAGLKSIGVDHFECAILPSFINKKDLYTIEQALQISQNFELDYDWVNEINNIREGLQDPTLNISEQDMIKNLRITNQKFRLLLDMGYLIDSFLVWRGEKNNYSYETLDKSEEAFRELAKAQKKFADDTTKLSSFNSQVFVLIEKPPKSGRLYDHIRNLVKHFEKIQSKIIDSEVVEIEPVKNDNTLDEFDDIIDKDDIDYNIFKYNKETIEDSSDNINEAIKDELESAKEIKDSQILYTKSKQALKLLTAIEVEESLVKISDTIENLKLLIKKSEDLINKLSKYE